MNKYPLVVKWLHALLLGVLVVYVLVAARALLYPLALAVLVAFLLLPQVRRLEQARFPRPLAILLCILLLLALVAGAVFLLYRQVYSFAHSLPALELKSVGQIERLGRWLAERSGVEPEQQNQWMKQQLAQVFSDSSGFLRTTLSATTGTLVLIGILPVYTFFLLYFRHRFRLFFFRLVPSAQHYQAKQVLEEISGVAHRYMTGVVLVVLILAALNTTGLYLIGVEYALLLGVISALFNFIPYFGTLLGGAVPLLLSLLTKGFTGEALAIALFFLGVQFLENNILTPRITGGKVQLNPFFTILIIIIGGMIWGLPGLIVSVPFLGMFRIVCRHVPALEPYAYLLGKD